MLFTTLLLAGTASATCMHNLKHFKRQEAGGEVPINTFGYTGLLGPLNWAALDPANEACKNSNNQSPINIDDQIEIAAEAPVVDIPEQEFEFENLGTTVEVIANGTTSFAGSDFRLRQFHFHSPSEHRVNEEYFPLEIHMVHEGVADASNIAVISLLFDLTSDPAETLETLQDLIPSIEAIQTPGTKTAVEGLRFEQLIAHVQTTPLFTYQGSLTTPPCAEGLTFLITQEPLKIDADTFNAIKKTVKFNSRYTQNTIGQDNLIAVAQLAGTADQQVPADFPGAEAPAAGGNNTAILSSAVQTTAAATGTAQPSFSEVGEENAATKSKAVNEAVVTDKAQNGHVGAAEKPKKIVTVTVQAKPAAAGNGHY